MKLTYNGTSLRKYILDNGGDVCMYSKVYSAIQRRGSEISVDDIIAHYLNGKEMPRKVRAIETYNMKGLGGKAFERKYEYNGTPVWKLLKGNDYFSCVRYIKRHPEISSDDIVEKFLNIGRSGVYSMIQKETKYGFDKLTLDGRNIRGLMDKQMYAKFCGHMKRNPGANHEQVARLILSGAKHVSSRRMWKGTPLIAVMNGCRKDVMRVTHYCRYHNCSIDDAMVKLSGKFGWTFDGNWIRKCR